MLFHEIYGSYYAVTAAILQAAAEGQLTRIKMSELIRNYAFSESGMTIPAALTGEHWRLLRNDYTTPLDIPPDTPLSELQKRWLKALLSDPRIRLFSPDESGLEDVKPLFTPDQFVYFDRYSDGDPYEDPNYISHFQAILTALRENKDIFLLYENRSGRQHSLILTPQYLEYSEKDDRFRLIASGERQGWIFNLSRILECTVEEDGENNQEDPFWPVEKRSLRFELTDERNALTRVLLHFSHLEKETKRLDESHYQVTLRYDREDETEMLIRILSFGPMIRVTEPKSFVERLRRRIERQQGLPGSDV